jgi:hypothetical protein
MGSRFTVQTNMTGQKVKHETQLSRRMSSTLKSRKGHSHNGTFNQVPYNRLYALPNSSLPVVAYQAGKAVICFGCWK